MAYFPRRIHAHAFSRHPGFGAYVIADGDPGEGYAEYVRADLVHGDDVAVRALLRAGCDLMAEEAESLKAGIAIIPTGDLSGDPADADAVARINEIEDWIASVAATINRFSPEGGA